MNSSVYYKVGLKLFGGSEDIRIKIGYCYELANKFSLAKKMY